MNDLQPSQLKQEALSAYARGELTVEQLTARIDEITELVLLENSGMHRAIWQAKKVLYQLKRRML